MEGVPVSIFNIKSITINYDGGLSGTAYIRRSTGPVEALDEFMVDTGLHTSVGNNGKLSNITLTSGQTYTVAIRGTWTWNWYGTWPIMYHGVNSVKDPVHGDPEWTEGGDQHAGYIQFSLNGGSSYSHIEPVGGVPSAYDPDHLYVYRVTGGGFPIRLGTGDSPIHDNYGAFKVFIVAGAVDREQITPLYGL